MAIAYRLFHSQKMLPREVFALDEIEKATIYAFYQQKDEDDKKEARKAKAKGAK
jgi:hypothetical protein